ncbi:MAG: hypothetical protein AAFN77_16640 [Planctomycetota bacterium]
MKRRTVQRIEPSTVASFDQQFWPVMVAITVLCGIAMGTLMTILRGPWLMGSLVGLMVVSIAAVFFLYHLDNNKLRRSLQFAIILSLAMHLLVMVFAAITNIFGNEFDRPERRVAQRNVRTIEISDQRASFVWEETNARETPEPEVEPVRDAQPTTDVKPQPIPVEETVTDVKTPQLTRRDSPKSTVPRQNRELSRLRSQRAKLQPRSSEKMTGDAIEVAAQPAPSPKPKVEVTESSSKANSVSRTAPEQPKATEPKRATAAASEPMSQPEITRAATAAARRATKSEDVAMSPPKPSSSSARIRRSESRMPTEVRSAPPAETKVAKATTPTPSAEPAKAAGQLTRRPTRTEANQPSKAPASRSVRSPETQVARAAERRSTQSIKPSISNPASVTTDPRRSTVEARVATSPIAVEQPSRSPESKTTSRDLKAKTLSVSRSSEGVVGIGRAKNLDRFVGGTPSPATQASDAARRERTLSRPDDTQMLISSTTSETRRASGTIKMPTSAFKADSSAAAKIAGSANPSERSLESSAAQVTSASTSHRDETSAERGSSSVDLGPTKIVNDLERSRRLSGGGQMEVSQLSPDSTRRSRDRSNRQPTLLAAEALEVASPRNLSTAPANAESIEASSEAIVESRAGGEAILSADRATAMNVGEASDRGETDLSRELADSRQRAKVEREDAGFGENEDDEERNENRAGRRTNRIAQSPVTYNDPGFGVAKLDGVTESRSNAIGEEATDTERSNLSKRSTAEIAGLGMSPSSSEIGSAAESSVPSVDNPSAKRREGRSANAQTTSSMTSELADSGSPRGQRNNRPLELGPMGDLELESGVATNETRTSNNAVESRSVDVDRVASRSSEQVQGIDLDIMAVEGPAGLAERPDEFIGVLARPASRDSEQVLPDLKSRFRNREFGGVPAMNPDAVIAKDAFRNRSPSSMAKAADPSTEAAIQLGLEFLARNQSPDGSWSLSGFDREAPQYLTQLDSDTAATGLAVLAFQGAGYNHREYKYARQLEKAVDWLIENQSDDGGLYVATDKKSNDACRLYSHGIASLALTEAYGMTQDPRLEKPAQKALDYIAATQDGRKGGWRYFDQPGKRSADTSVSGWMMMAMQSGRLAGLKINATTFDGIEDWLDVAADPDNQSLYRYNPYAVDSKGVSRIQGRRPSASMTSVGLLMRIYAGWKKDDPRLLAGADYLLKTQMPSDSTPQLRDTYYWYYATQVLKHVDGPHWEQWDSKLRPLLTRSQEKTGDMAGSWHPYRPVPDRWGSFGGRIYVTSMNLLSLEVRHRLLPLYQQQDAPQLMGIIEKGEQFVDAGQPADDNRLREVVGTFDTIVDREGPRKPPPIESAMIDPEDADSDLSPGDLLPSLDPATTPDADAIDIARNSNVNPAPQAVVPVEAEINDQVVMNRGKRNQTENAEIGSADGADVAKLIQSQSREPGSDPEIAMSIKRNNIDSRTEVSRVEPLPTEPPNSNRGEASRQRVALKPVISAQALPVDLADVKMSPMPGPKQPSQAMPDGGNPETETIRFGSITGTVVLDGEALSNARVEFIPTDESAKRMIARTNRLGQYSVTSANTKSGNGIRSGEYKISITTSVETPDLDVIELLEIVPERYNKETTLKTNINPDALTKLNLELEFE